MKQSRRIKEKSYWLIGIATGLLLALYLAYPLLDISPKPQARQIAQPAVISRPVNPELTKLVNAFEKEIQKIIKRTGIPGAAIAIVKDSTFIYTKGFGFRTADTHDSINEHSVFRLASVSKPFASFLTGILVEENQLSWDDRVVKYLPDFQLIDSTQTSLLNITHVLSHTTGLPYHTYTNLVEEGIDLVTLLGKLREVKMSNKVGREYSYQNVAYSLIGEVILKSTGKTYEDQMMERVFRPLGMADASMNYETLVNDDNVAYPHRRGRRKWFRAKINDTYYNVAPAGGVNASISDMSKWMVALLGCKPKVIKPATMEKLYEPVIDARSRNRHYRKIDRISESSYGLGWRILYYPSDTLVYHGGYVTGYRSEIGFNPHDKIGICILTNAPGELADTAVPLFFNLYKKHREKILQWEREQNAQLPI
ncbi:MAG TPA: serine hydrolase domain-containing protein [Chryseosolibacter sp.]|nr:serine hydrolase domain-containing protein [Chryseosolibacter sp.]